jgi:hypothetical protein
MVKSRTRERPPAHLPDLLQHPPFDASRLTSDGGLARSSTRWSPWSASASSRLSAAAKAKTTPAPCAAIRMFKCVKRLHGEHVAST